MRAKTKAQARLKDKKTARPKSPKPQRTGAQSGAPAVRATCPDCDARINFGGKPRFNQSVVCHDCESELIVVSLSPLELDFAD